MTIPPWQFQAAYTPPLIKRLIQIIATVTLVSVGIDSFFSTNLQGLVMISPLTYLNFFLWQPFTALFLIPAATFSFGFLLDLAFAMLLFWLLGSLLLERIGQKRFLTFYMLSGLVSGAAALLYMYLSSTYSYTSECLPALLAITTLWTMGDPHQQLNLFFVFPIRANWILAFALFGTIVTSLVHHNFASFFSYLAAFLFGYLYGLFVCGFSSPFKRHSLFA